MAGGLAGLRIPDPFGGKTMRGLLAAVLLVGLSVSAFAQDCSGGVCTGPVRKAARGVFQTVRNVRPVQTAANVVVGAAQGVRQGFATVRQTRQSGGSCGSVQVQSNYCNTYVPQVVEACQTVQVCQPVDYAVVETVVVSAPAVVATVPMASASAVDSPLEIQAMGEAVGAAQDGFKSQLVMAIKSARDKGSISALQYTKLRLACLSPSFCKHAQDLVLTEGLSSGAIKPEADGSVQVAAIDWNQLADFIERMVPIILQILKLFSVV